MDWFIYRLVHRCSNEPVHRPIYGLIHRPIYEPVHRWVYFGPIMIQPVCSTYRLPCLFSLFLWNLFVGFLPSPLIADETRTFPLFALLFLLSLPHIYMLLFLLSDFWRPLQRCFPKINHFKRSFFIFLQNLRNVIRVMRSQWEALKTVSWCSRESWLIENYWVVLPDLEAQTSH